MRFINKFADYWRQVCRRSPAMYNYSRSPRFYAEREVSIKNMKKEVKEVSSVVNLIRVGMNFPL
ncbi:unnamed protein product [Arabidopsis halleri]